MNKHERFIKNRTGHRPFICNVNKHLSDWKLSEVYHDPELVESWRATIPVKVKDALIQGKTISRKLALVSLAQIVKKYNRKDFRSMTTK